MVTVTRREQTAIRKKFGNVFFKSTRHKIFVEPRRDIMAYLAGYRSNH